MSENSTIPAPTSANHAVARLVTLLVIDLVPDGVEFEQELTKYLNRNENPDDIALDFGSYLAEVTFGDGAGQAIVDKIGLGSAMQEGRCLVIAAAIKQAIEYAQHHYQQAQDTQARKSGASA